MTDTVKNVEKALNKYLRSDFLIMFDNKANSNMFAFYKNNYKEIRETVSCLCPEFSDEEMSEFWDQVDDLVKSKSKKAIIPKLVNVTMIRKLVSGFKEIEL